MGICNLAYCVLKVLPDKSYKVEEWKRIHLQSDKKNLELLSMELIDILDHITYDIIENNKNDDVPQCIWLIENQPAFKAPTMKSLQMVIYTYVLLLRKTIDDRYRVKFISASSKLRYIEKKTGDKVDKKYKSHKNASIDYTKKLIEHDKTLMDIFVNEKKKDDIADCFLQALYFIDAF